MLIALAALLAGIAGTWSPCGLSAIDTLRAREGGRSTRAPLAAFGLGALAGGAATFTALGALGSLASHGHAHGLRIGLAIAVAAIAAIADLRGARIRPQVRRQVPEPWRRDWPLPLAAGAYGVLLGLGFTTYVLAFVLWAAAALTLALGSASLGLAAGLAFGVGRALPVLAIAPIAGRPRGARLLTAMEERPIVLLGVRRAAGVVLIACAVGLALAPRVAARTLAAPATDPSADGGLLAWQVPGVGGILRLPDGRQARLPGSAPALGDGLVAYLEGGAAHVVRLAGLAPVVTVPAPNADALAVSSRWLVLHRVLPNGATAIDAVSLVDPAHTEVVASASSPSGVGRPSIDGARVVWARSSTRASAIRELDLGTGRRRTLLSAHSRAGYADPTLRHSWLLYVRQTRCDQQLRLRSLVHPSHRRRLLARGPLGLRDLGYQPGYPTIGSASQKCPQRRRARTFLWSTALTDQRAFVTLVHINADASLGAASIAILAR